MSPLGGVGGAQGFFFPLALCLGLIWGFIYPYLSPQKGGPFKFGAPPFGLFFSLFLEGPPLFGGPLFFFSSSDFLGRRENTPPLFLWWVPPPNNVLGCGGTPPQHPSVGVGNNGRALIFFVGGGHPPPLSGGWYSPFTTRRGPRYFWG